MSVHIKELVIKASISERDSSPKNTTMDDQLNEKLNQLRHQIMEEVEERIDILRREQVKR